MPIRLPFKHIALLLSCFISSAVLAENSYKIDPEHTFSSFEYQHWGLSTQRGRFDKNIGSITMDTESKSGSINLEIDASSVNTGSEAFNRAMRSSNFFDAENYPKISFSSDKLIFSEDKLTQVIGKLTIKNTTLPVTIEVTQFNCRFMILYLREACGANGYTKILRSDFKVGRYVPFVSDEVTLYFNVEAIKE
ncbi:YceI family protein [Undibacterium sp. SXout11W]|uniref:YceI family protein n=1 Tax=Undibacterium sp. SXout11W TaxID=3413050 RepID=UPI003BF36F2F